MVAKRFYKLFRFGFLRVRISGMRNLAESGPLILVSNHVGSFGPMTVMSSLPLRLHPWVSGEVTVVATAARRIGAEFVEGELGLRPPVSRWIARILGWICVALMRDVGAIPVYDRSRRIRRTVYRSLELLQKGRNILVFPENSDAPLNEVLCDFRTGFIHVARLYYERTMKAIAFLPVAVNRRVQGIRIGTPIRFDASVPFPAEKLRLKRELERTIYRLYCDLERAPQAGRESVALKPSGIA